MKLERLSNPQLNRLYSAMRDMNHCLDMLETCQEAADEVIDWNELFDAVSEEVSHRYPVTPSGKPYFPAGKGDTKELTR